MDRQKIKALYVFLLLILPGCQQSPRDESSKQTDKEKFNNDVVETYNKYIKEYRSHTPRSTELVGTVTSMGEAGRSYALYRAGSADITEFQAALSVLSSYSQKCSSKEYNNLQKYASHLSSLANTRAALLGYVDVACHAKPPPGWQ